MAELLAARDAATAGRHGRAASRRRRRPRRRRGARGPAASRSIVTCRPTWEGGRFDGREEERRRDPRAGARRSARSTWTSSGAPGFDDRRSRSDPAARRRCRPTTSTACPPTSTDRARAMRATGAGDDQGGGHAARRLCDTLPLLRDRRAAATRSSSAWATPACRRGCSPRASARAGPMPARRGARADSGGADAATSSASATSAPRRGCSASSAATRCIRCRRPCTTPRSRRPASTRCTCRSRPPTSPTS